VSQPAQPKPKKNAKVHVGDAALKSSRPQGLKGRIINIFLCSRAQSREGQNLYLSKPSRKIKERGAK
jgi:hypothetical protein